MWEWGVCVCRLRRRVCFKTTKHQVGPSADAGRRPCDETDAHMMSGGRVRAATRRVEDALLHEYDHLARRTGGTTSRAALLAKKYGFASETTVWHKLARARERRSTAEVSASVWEIVSKLD